MSGFAIYNYNFLRIIRPNEEYQLEFPDWVKVNVQESFENRQQLLEELLLTDFEKPFPFENARKKPYWHKQIVKPHIIRKTKCYRFAKRNVPKRKTKRLRYRCPPEPYSNSVRTDFFSYSNAIILENQQINTSI